MHFCEDLEKSTLSFKTFNLQERINILWLEVARYRCKILSEWQNNNNIINLLDSVKMKTKQFQRLKRQCTRPFATDGNLVHGAWSEWCVREHQNIITKLNYFTCDECPIWWSTSHPGWSKVILDQPYRDSVCDGWNVKDYVTQIEKSWSCMQINWKFMIKSIQKLYAKYWMRC